MKFGNLDSSRVREKSGIFPELYVPPSGKELPPGDESGVLLTKNTVFRVFAEQVSPGAAFMPPGATDFPSLRSFRKTAFPGSLTVRFR